MSQSRFALDALLRSSPVCEALYVLNMEKLSDKKLRRFRFKSSKNGGIGITAYSRKDAEEILNGAIKRHNLGLEIVEVLEDINIQDLDQGGVIPNMNPPNFRGIWFPMLNENLRNKWI